MTKGKNTMAEELNEDDKCTATGKKHEPDWASVATSGDGQETYVDVTCKDCGRGGCVGTVKHLVEDINW
jgi:hypothetical protein